MAAEKKGGTYTASCPAGQRGGIYKGRGGVILIGIVVGDEGALPPPPE